MILLGVVSIAESKVSAPKRQLQDMLYYTTGAKCIIGGSGPTGCRDVKCETGEEIDDVNFPEPYGSESAEWVCREAAYQLHQAGELRGGLFEEPYSLSYEPVPEVVTDDSGKPTGELKNGWPFSDNTNSRRLLPPGCLLYHNDQAATPIIQLYQNNGGEKSGHSRVERLCKKRAVANYDDYGPNNLPSGYEKNNTCLAFHACPDEMKKRDDAGGWPCCMPGNPTCKENIFSKDFPECSEELCCVSKTCQIVEVDNKKRYECIGYPWEPSSASGFSGSQEHPTNQYGSR